MYGLSRNINLNFFIGKKLEFIGLGKSSIIMKFDEKVEISIETIFTFNNKLLEPKDGHLLHELLRKKIISAKHGKKNGDLELEFEGDNSLILHDDSKQYQSYNFWSPEGLVVV